LCVALSLMMYVVVVTRTLGGEVVSNAALF